MASLDEDTERDMIDFMTQSMFSVSFLDAISNEIFGGQPPNSTREFHRKWNEAVSPKEGKVPISPGIIVAHICMCFLLPRQHWMDLLPDVDVILAAPEWGFSQYAELVDSNVAAVTVKHAIRRIRNAFCHGNVKITVPTDNINMRNIFDRVTLTLKDFDARNPQNTLTCTASLNSLLLTVRAMQSVAHNEITKKYNISHPK